MKALEVVRVPMLERKMSCARAMFNGEDVDARYDDCHILS